MRIPELRSWLQSIPRSAYVAALVVLLMIVAGQALRNSNLQLELSRARTGVAALLRERADLKGTAEAWEKEAVEYRVKYGEPEPSRDPPTINEAERETIYAPDDPRP